MRSLFLAGWFAVLIVGVSASLIAGASLTIGYAMLLFTLGFLPPAVVLMVFRGAPPRSVGEALYVDEHARQEVTRRLDRLTRHDDPRV
jgi:hypothetical protein